MINALITAIVSPFALCLFGYGIYRFFMALLEDV